jgi:hypothetical protein
MTTFWCARALTTVLLGSTLTGCGIVIPDIKEAWDADHPKDETSEEFPAAGQIELQVKAKVFCELEHAVQFVNNNYPVSKGSSPSTLKPFAKYPIPWDWLAQVSLSFQVDESSSLSPGVVLTEALPNSVQTFGPGNSVTTAQSRSIGFGGTLSSTATRTDKFNPSYSVRYLMSHESPGSLCQLEDPFAGHGWAKSSPFILEGDLGIRKWLEGAVITDVLISSQVGPPSKSGSGAGGGGGGLKTDAYSYEIKFIIVSSGNVTPTWKLVQVSANTTGTFFGTGRTRTHDLIITIGPNDTRTLDAHLASEIGQAVSGANGARLTPQQ